MKRFIFLVAIMSLVLNLGSQESFIEQSLVINIEVPVRVFDNDIFIEDLKKSDFQIFENGKQQSIEAVYFIKKRTVERSEETRRFNPETDRNFFLFFELAEYDARIGEAVDWFVNTVVYPGDNLYIITPLKTYHLRTKALESKLREEIASELKGMIRQDTLQGNAEYRDIVEDLSQVTRSIAALIGSADGNTPVAPSQVSENDRMADVRTDTLLNDLFMQYTEYLGRLDNIRKVDQFKLLDFAEYLKYQFGQKYVFMFYEQEFVPRISDSLLEKYNSLQMGNMSQIFQTMSLFDFHRRDTMFDVEKVRQAYADASTAIHFLFFTRRPTSEPGIRMEESSEDIFSAFRQMAQSTGGLVEVSSRPVKSLQQAIAASENYYLLYYAPKEYVPDGNFRKITVTIKGKKFRVVHREGYFSN